MGCGRHNGAFSFRRFLATCERPYALVNCNSRIGTGVCIWRGEILYPFAIAGAFFVLFYTYPLKRIALGEVAVLLTWGPLMVGGTYAAIHGEFDRFVLLAGLVYGLGPTVVIFAEHTDKASDDRHRGVVTLPSLLGRVAAPSIPLLGMLQIAAAVVVGITYGSYGMLASLLGIPALWRLSKVCFNAAPLTRPADYPENLWPLCYTTHAFEYARLAGLLLFAGVFGHLLVFG